MELSFVFFFNSILLGTGLAMDAFSVSLANGLNEHNMKLVKMFGISGVFALFQAIMPLIGWLCVHTVVQYFSAFEALIPWVALALLGYIGSKMLVEGIQNQNTCELAPPVTLTTLLIQGIATSIDALSVGFTIAEYDLSAALLCALIIAVVTFILCLFGLFIGKKAGCHLAGKAGILGGAILLLIGLEIFISSWF